MSVIDFKAAMDGKTYQSNTVSGNEFGHLYQEWVLASYQADDGFEQVKKSYSKAIVDLALTTPLNNGVEEKIITCFNLLNSSQDEFRKLSGLMGQICNQDAMCIEGAAAKGHDAWISDMLMDIAVFLFGKGETERAMSLLEASAVFERDGVGSSKEA